jgi:ElaA protein
LSDLVACHRWSSFADLGRDELYALLKLRADVFVVEQRCAYADIDGRDPDARHLLVWTTGREDLAGCLRVFAPGSGTSDVRIGRVATAAFARGRGLGRWMMSEALAESARRFGATGIELDAQVASEAFYGRLGFRRVSADFDEDGIMHCTMRFVCS